MKRHYTKKKIRTAEYRRKRYRLKGYPEWEIELIMKGIEFRIPSLARHLLEDEELEQVLVEE